MRLPVNKIACLSLLMISSQLTMAQIKSDSVMKKASNWRQAMLANYRIGVSAHRGASGAAPENTLATFKQVLAMQVDYIEIDVRTSLDGQLMILHDGQLNRTTTGTGPLKDKTAAELKQLSAGKGYGDAYAAEQIPTLAEVCALLADWNARHKHQTHLYVDCKDVDPKPLVEPFYRHTAN